jgi:hypothetical protein
MPGMKDRPLLVQLEFAASALGLKLVGEPNAEGIYGVLCGSDENCFHWSPHNLDSDSMRLAADLCLNIVHTWDVLTGKPAGSVFVCRGTPNPHDRELTETPYDNNVRQAVRTATLLAAAEMGLAMQRGVKFERASDTYRTLQ